jgi:hypothetical protein
MKKKEFSINLIKFQKKTWVIVLFSSISASSLVNKFVYVFDSASDYHDLESLELKKEAENGTNLEEQKGGPQNR